MRNTRDLLVSGVRDSELRHCLNPFQTAHLEMQKNSIRASGHYRAKPQNVLSMCMI